MTISKFRFWKILGRKARTGSFVERPSLPVNLSSAVWRPFSPFRFLIIWFKNYCLYLKYLKEKKYLRMTSFIVTSSTIIGCVISGKSISRSSQRTFKIGKLSKPWWLTVDFHGLQYTVWFHHFISFQNEIIRGIKYIGWIPWIFR